MVDPRDELTDVRMPEVGTDGHVALLVTEYLAARADDDRSGCPTSELHALVRRLAKEHQRILAKQHARPGRRGRARRARPRAALGAASHPPRRRRHPSPAGARARFALADADARADRRPPRRSREPTSRTGTGALAAAAAGAGRSLLLRPRGVRVPRRAAAAARQQRDREVKGARADASVPARRRPVRPSGRARRRPEQADGVEPAARRRAPQRRAPRLRLAGVRPQRRGRCRVLHDRLWHEGREGPRDRRALVLRHRPARRRGRWRSSTPPGSR